MCSSMSSARSVRSFLNHEMGVLDFWTAFAVFWSSSTASEIISASVGLGGEMGDGASRWNQRLACLLSSGHKS